MYKGRSFANLWHLCFAGHKYEYKKLINDLRFYFFTSSFALLTGGYIVGKMSLFFFPFQVTVVATDSTGSIQTVAQQATRSEPTVTWKRKVEAGPYSPQRSPQTSRSSVPHSQQQLRNQPRQTPPVISTLT